MSERRALPASRGFWIVGTFVGGVVFLGHWGLGYELSRDESVYAYAGQQLAHGVAPYASIFDPKGPVAAFLAAVGALLGSASGHSELVGIRLVYGLVASLSVTAVFLLVREVWGGALAGIGAGLALCCFPAFSADAFSGPDAKTPALLFLTLTMWLALRHRWVLAGAFASLATLTWQPLVILPVLLVVLVWQTHPSDPTDPRHSPRWAVLSGIVTILLLCLGFFVVTGTVGVAFDATVRFPLEGIKHGQTSALARLQGVGHASFDDGLFRGLAWMIGALSYVALTPRLVRRQGVDWSSRLRHPVTLIVVFPSLLLAGYCLIDFQGGPDLLPLLPFGAIGIGGLLSLAGLQQWKWRTLPLIPALVLGICGVGAWAVPSGGVGNLGCQRAQVGSMVASAGGSQMWMFGDPTPLVLSQQRNPDRFVYLASGVAEWKRIRTSRGMHGWEAEINRANPRVVAFSGYDEGDIYRELVSMFNREGYRQTKIGRWHVYLAPGVPLRGNPPRACGG